MLKTAACSHEPPLQCGSRIEGFTAMRFRPGSALLATALSDNAAAQHETGVRCFLTKTMRF